MAATASTDRNVSLDVLRTLALFGVVSIHASVGSPADFAYWFNEIPRFVVPAYFLLSGYFWKSDELQQPGRLVRRVAVRVIPAFMLWMAIYLAVEWMRDPAALADRLTPKQLVVLLWTGGPGHHLWFLPALLIGTAIVAYALKWFGWRTTAILAVAAYVTGTVIGTYGQLLGGEIGDLLAKNASLLFRNGLFMAPIFLATGALLRRHRDLVANIPIWLAAALTAVFCALHVGEGYFVLGFRETGHDYAFATYFYAVAVFILFLKLDLRGSAWVVLGRASFTAFLVHLLVLQILIVDLDLQLPLVPNVALVSILSFAVALAIGGLRGALNRLYSRAWHRQHSLPAAE